MKTSSEIRSDFLNFFQSKGHTIVPSASVIPFDDPTLLFTNAGMNQFKDIFLGKGTRNYKRCADTQKCIRVSGKHNDLEEVGHDGYHHTFFEMLGNWSFGDYYKEEVIRWAWELLTEVWKIPKQRLWATVYNSDDESFELWRKVTDINNVHVLRFDEKENFWEMGETGPCGPSSEIHIDLTKDGCRASDINAGNQEVIELWNLVFIQYDRDSKGVLLPLPERHVDTGLGLERLTRVLQNKKSNYETDIFLPLLNELIQITGFDYSSENIISSMNVVSDHVRALTFAVADGAIPSNEGRGYVLRRILRRAARYGRNLGMHRPFIYKLAGTLADTMGGVFPEIVEKKSLVEEIIKSEEESFNQTLDRGLTLFNEEIENMKNSGTRIFSGQAAFKLHDTYGFPIDLTQLLAKEKGYELDVKEFQELMDMQKIRARIDRTESQIQINKETIQINENALANSRYNPYDTAPEGVETKVLQQIKTEDISRNLLVLDVNPFYFESGGQVSDTGRIILADGKELEVENVYNEKTIIVRDKFENEIPPVNEKVLAYVNLQRRKSIQRNHSATHLVHEALRRVLGGHVRQMGSYLDDKSLRFDFPHFHKLSPEDIKNIEELVNEKVIERIDVNAEKMAVEKANRIPNVKKLFGEKYSSEVRVIFIDENFSVEFCGGTHVAKTDDIGLFKIVKEESVSSGIRRIFARTGEGIILFLNERISEIERLSSEIPSKYYGNFRTSIDALKKELKTAGFQDNKLLEKLLKTEDSTLNTLLEVRGKYIEEKKKMEKKTAKDKVKNAASMLQEIIENSMKTDSLRIVTSRFEVDNMDELKEIADSLRLKIDSGAGLIYAVINDKVNMVTVISDNLVKEKGLNAGIIANEVAKILGGGGGGKPHLATAGGKDISRIDEAVSKFPDIIKKYL